jgi:hypothetical protein
LFVVYCFWNVVAHSDAWEGKSRGNWRKEWVASTLTWPRNMVYPELLTLMRTPQLPAVEWTNSPADLNGLIRLGERWNLVSAHVPSGSAQALTVVPCDIYECSLVGWCILNPTLLWPISYSSHHWMDVESIKACMCVHGCACACTYTCRCARISNQECLWSESFPYTIHFMIKFLCFIIIISNFHLLHLWCKQQYFFFV